MSTGLPSFDRAEFLPSDTVPDAHGVADRCAGCGRSVGPYFRLDGRPMCELCLAQTEDKTISGSHAAFARALVLGAAAATAGLALYAGIEIATGWVIGYAAIAVGYLVGKGIKVGSGGRGGRRYQIAAALLTYLAVAMAAIPVAMHSYAQQRHSVQSTNPYATAPNSPIHEDAAPRRGVTLELLATGFASPLLELEDGVSGLIGLFILFLGVRTAWQLARGSERLVTGPHRGLSRADVAAAT